MMDYIKKEGIQIPIFFNSDSVGGGRRLVEHNIISSDYNPVEDTGRKNQTINLTFTIYQSKQFDKISNTGNQIISILESAGIVTISHTRYGIMQLLCDSFSSEWLGGAVKFECQFKKHVERKYQVTLDEKIFLIDKINQAGVVLEGLLTEYINEGLGYVDVGIASIKTVGNVFRSATSIFNKVVSVLDKPIEVLDEIKTVKEDIDNIAINNHFKSIIKKIDKIDGRYGSLVKEIKTNNKNDYLINSYIYLSITKKIINNKVNDEETIIFIDNFKRFIYSKHHTWAVFSSLGDIIHRLNEIYIKGVLNIKGGVLLECKNQPYLVAWFAKFGNLINCFNEKNIEQLVDINQCEKDIFIYE
jgi:hypothetical protein